MEELGYYPNLERDGTIDELLLPPPPPPQEATLDDQSQTGFVCVAGFRASAGKHMVGALHHTLPHDAAIYFLFNYIEDSITFLIPSYE